MNPPNALTVSRFFMAGAMMALLFAPWPFSRTAALLVFVLAALTDAVDGRLARRVYGVTPLGALLDPLADKVLVCAALVSFVEIRLPGLARPLVPAWIVVLIIAREFLVTGLRVLAGSRGRPIAAGRWGKHKTIWQMTIIVVALAGLAWHDDWLAGAPESRVLRFRAVYPAVVYCLAVAAAAITMISGVIYYRAHRDLVRRQGEASAG